MYNRIAAAPGVDIKLGTQGGVLLLGPPGRAPGAMTLADLQNRTWHLLRENGPDNGYAAPTFGDFPQVVVTRDLNIALAEFISQTGLAPGLTERMDTLPVYAGKDAPVPPGLQSLTMLEYTPAGKQTYQLQGVSLAEFGDRFSAALPQQTGQPQYYREPFAGQIRLLPAPGLGNQNGYGVGSIVLSGIPVAGQTIHATLAIPGLAAVVTANYIVVAGDTLSTIASGLATKINVSAAVTGATAFLAQATTSSSTITLSSLTTPGTTITYSVTVTGAGFTATPTSATNLAPNGDTMTWYYTATGNVLVNPGDSPAIPPQFHMALVYRVLSDYWERKQDAGQADRYMKKFEMQVQRGKAYTFDSNRATQPTTAGVDDSEDMGWS